MFTNCMNCKSWGVIVAVERVSGYTYAFACQCGMRKEANQCYPVWKDAYKFKYKADFLDDDLTDPRQATADQTSVKKQQEKLTDMHTSNIYDDEDVPW